MEIDVSTNTYLLDVFHASNITYAEGITNESGVINTVRIKTISESIPEMRLTRLLRKKQFDAAEAFAERLGLSMEPIYCSKAALLVEQLGFWTKSAHSASVDELINILDKIQDVRYVIECCSKALISNISQMRQIYLYARQRIVQNIKVLYILIFVNISILNLYYLQEENDPLNASLSLMNDALHRLETFQIIQDIETDTLSSDDAVTKEWIRFSQINLLKECATRLRMVMYDLFINMLTRNV